VSEACLLVLPQYYIRVFPPSFVALTVNERCLSFFTTVLAGATAFNSDISKWDVSQVTNMNESKSNVYLRMT
jgi:surface protein